MAIPTGTCIGHYQFTSCSARAAWVKAISLRTRTSAGESRSSYYLSEFTKDENRVRRFQQEARAASALNHPNILTIHEIGSENRDMLVDVKSLKQELEFDAK